MLEGDATRSYQAPRASRAQKIRVKRTSLDDASESDMPWLVVYKDQHVSVAQLFTPRAQGHRNSQQFGLADNLLLAFG